jgi:hypothetical protein
MLGGELRWTPSLIVCNCGADGASLSLHVSLGWVCRRTSGKVGDFL